MEENHRALADAKLLAGSNTRLEFDPLSIFRAREAVHDLIIDGGYVLKQGHGVLLCQLRAMREGALMRLYSCDTTLSEAFPVDCALARSMLAWALVQ